jgi:hypothetical protein
MIPLRNRFAVSTDRAARIRIAQFGNAEIIADWIDGWLGNRLKNRFT